MSEYEVLSDPPKEQIIESVEELCLVRFMGNVDLKSYGITSTFKGDTSDKMFDVPCNFYFSSICAIEIPSAIETQKTEMMGSPGGPWPKCVIAGKIVKNFNVRFRLSTRNIHITELYFLIMGFYFINYIACIQ